jgi:putative ABC transport system permease protein
LHSHSNYELSPPGNAMYVYIFGAIGIFMMLIACINFINLATASASKRAKEVGVRKVIGGGKSQLIKQFLVESSMLVCMALVISLVLVKLALPEFNHISGKDLHLIFNTKITTSFIALGIAVAFIAGMYPAYFLSSFKPIAVLKGKVSGNNKSFGLRSSLVVFQFCISLALIISTMVVWQQMRFIQNKNLGYDKEQLLTIPNSYVLRKNEAVYKQEMIADSRIVNATTSSYKPAGPSSGGNALAYPQGNDKEIMKTQQYHIDENYIPTFEMKIVAGRNFSKDFPSDSTAMIINQTAAKAFGWNSDVAIGHTIIRQNSSRGNNVPYHIIGVVKDFNFQSLHEPVTPLLMTLEPDYGLIFKVKTADIQGLLTTMKSKWNKFNTGEPFTFTFMDDLYNKTYSAERNTGTILNIFAILTIFVACLGLFGLATSAAEQRTREIGIRKVLGATVASVTTMLSKDFIMPVIIACLIAFPLSWWAMNKWLQSFAYRIDISPWIFLAVGVAGIVIALITVSFQAIKAAVANPVKSLRSE